MLGVAGRPGDSIDTDVVNRESARVQSVVAFCAPEDFSAAFPTYASTAIASLIGTARPPNEKRQSGSCIGPLHPFSTSALTIRRCC